MHLLESYALVSASKIDKPWITTEYYPIPFDKYIVFHNGSSNPARKYDFWHEVMEYIIPVLEREGIKVAQIGGRDDELIEGIADFRGSTKRQMQHIVEHSMMFLGNDTCSAHFASALGKDIVMLHSCLYPENSRPYWSNESNCVILEAPRGDKKPSFSMAETPKTINGINPEDIANEFFKMLGIEDRVSETTEYTGREFSGASIDIIPDKPFDPQFAGKNVNFRLDLVHDLTHIAYWAHNCKIQIITKQFIPPQLLAALKGNIIAVSCDTEGEFTVEQVKAMRKSGVGIAFFCRGDEQAIEKARADFFEEHVHWIEQNRPKFESLDNLFFYSNRMLFDKENAYLTEWHWSAKIPAENRMKVVDEAILDASQYIRVVSE